MKKHILIVVLYFITFFLGFWQGKLNIKKNYQEIQLKEVKKYVLTSSRVSLKLKTKYLERDYDILLADEINVRLDSIIDSQIIKVLK